MSTVRAIIARPAPLRVFSSVGSEPVDRQHTVDRERTPIRDLVAEPVSHDPGDRTHLLAIAGGRIPERRAPGVEERGIGASQRHHLDGPQHDDVAIEDDPVDAARDAFEERHHTDATTGAAPALQDRRQLGGRPRPSHAGATAGPTLGCVRVDDHALAAIDGVPTPLALRRRRPRRRHSTRAGHRSAPTARRRRSCRRARPTPAGGGRGTARPQSSGASLRKSARTTAVRAGSKRSMRSTIAAGGSATAALPAWIDPTKSAGTWMSNEHHSASSRVGSGPVPVPLVATTRTSVAPSSRTSRTAANAPATTSCFTITRRPANSGRSCSRQCSASGVTNGTYRAAERRRMLFPARTGTTWSDPAAAPTFRRRDADLDGSDAVRTSITPAVAMTRRWVALGRRPELKTASRSGSSTVKAVFRRR